MMAAVPSPQWNSIPAGAAAESRCEDVHGHRRFIGGGLLDREHHQQAGIMPVGSRAAGSPVRSFGRVFQRHPDNCFSSAGAVKEEGIFSSPLSNPNPLGGGSEGFSSAVSGPER